MSSSHASSPRPSPLLALVALGIVHRLRPAWLAVELKDAAHQQNVRAERLSRLVTAVLAGFEGVLATLTRRGRPPRSHDEDDARPELALTRELLAVATALLARAAPRRSDGRALVVGAWLRLASIIGPQVLGNTVGSGSIGGAFLVFGLVALAASVVVALFAVETKSRVLEEISP